MRKEILLNRTINCTICGKLKGNLVYFFTNSDAICSCCFKSDQIAILHQGIIDRVPKNKG